MNTSPSLRWSLAGLVLGWTCLSSVQGESVARIWNEQNLDAIRGDFPNPPVHARNLFHTSVAMWDAWAAYSDVAVGYLHREKASAADLTAAREEAISYAAFGLLSYRYSYSVSADATQAALEAQMRTLNYDPSFTSTEGDSPAALGNRVAATVIAFAASDQSKEENAYQDTSYFPVNQPLLLLRPGTTMFFPNRWQPLAFDVAFSQNGLVADQVQTFLGSHWGAVRPFGMALQGGDALYFDPGPPPLLGTETDDAFKQGNVVVIERSRDLDPGNGEWIDLSPSALGNHTLGKNDGTGHPVNPVTGQPYSENRVPLGDYGRVIAEFWADGPDSETPPGHWNTLANNVVDHPLFEARFQGEGVPLDPLEWDVKLYFALNGAAHDAAVAVWGCKAHYDYVRPISSIRYMGQKGQSTDVRGPVYHERGLPLIPGLIEVVTEASSAEGQRHEGLVVGQVALYAWGGEPEDPESEYTGTRWIHAVNWMPYQRDTFVTPAFAGYVSGHSAFSRAAAEVLHAITGSPYFPGGLATFTAPKDDFLEFEEGPSVDVELQWATYYDAADEAGISRLYGGIHVPADDGPGRIVGSQCGEAAWDMAKKYFDGSILEEPLELSYERLPDGRYRIQSTAARGLKYALESGTDLETFTPVEAAVQAGEVTIDAIVEPEVDEAVFFRFTRLNDQ